MSDNEEGGNVREQVRLAFQGIELYSESGSAPDASGVTVKPLTSVLVAT
jgi:hypothetical protein